MRQRVIDAILDRLKSRQGTTTMDSAATTTDPQDNSLAGARAWFAHNGLTRPRKGRLIAGVTAGFARRFGVNVLVARVAVVVGVVVLTPLLYLPLWVLMPKDVAA
jgi:phage shock protein PspC (stress-responsive transcriptional regulator)